MSITLHVEKIFYNPLKFCLLVYKCLKTRHKPIVSLSHLANKLLRIIWHMLTKNVTYEDTNKACYRIKLKKVMAAQ